MTCFVDTAVIMYAAGRPHPLREPCRTVLSYVAGGRFDAVISSEVVQEILHRFSVSGQVDLGTAMAQDALDLFAPVLPVGHMVMVGAVELARRYPLLPSRDIVHAATCAHEGIAVIVSPDGHFEEFEHVRRVAPDDAEAVEALLSG